MSKLWNDLHGSAPVKQLAPNRTSITKKVRFEVFKRDGFRCQYCGGTAPDVLLHVDHINPVSKGGQNDIINLVTSCVDCNLGKGPRELSDTAAVEKQRRQLEELSEKREQLAMMVKWRDELVKLDDEKVEIVVRAKNAAMPGWSTNDAGRETIRGWLKKFPIDLILEAIPIAARKHIRIGPDGKALEAGVVAFSRYVGGVAWCKLRERTDPQAATIFRIKGIFKRRFNLDFGWQEQRMIRGLFNAGLDQETAVACALEARTNRVFWTQLEALVL